MDKDDRGKTSHRYKSDDKRERDRDKEHDKEKDRIKDKEREREKEREKERERDKERKKGDDKDDGKHKKEDHHHRHHHHREDSKKSKSRSQSKSHERDKRKGRVSHFDDPNPLKLNNIITQTVFDTSKESKWTDDPNKTTEINAQLLANYSTSALLNFQDLSKVRKKIYLPKDTGINYIGLLIGPKGMYQKKLEEQTNCKILIRGKGSQKDGQPPQPDDNDDLHVLIVGDTEPIVAKAEMVINSVIYSDSRTRNAIRQEQLKVAEEMNKKILGNIIDESLLTPYGPPSKDAHIIPVPNDCVGLIIGKNGETIRKLQLESGAKIQVAKKEVAETGMRNVFIEGPPSKYEKAKQLIEEIVDQHKSIHVVSPNSIIDYYVIPNNFTGLIIGLDFNARKRG